MSQPWYVFNISPVVYFKRIIASNEVLFTPRPWTTSRLLLLNCTLTHQLFFSCRLSECRQVICSKQPGGEEGGERVSNPRTHQILPDLLPHPDSQTLWLSWAGFSFPREQTVAGTTFVPMQLLSLLACLGSIQNIIMLKSALSHLWDDGLLILYIPFKLSFKYSRFLKLWNMSSTCPSFCIVTFVLFS